MTIAVSRSSKSFCFKLLSGFKKSILFKIELKIEWNIQNFILLFCVKIYSGTFLRLKISAQSSQLPTLLVKKNEKHIPSKNFMAQSGVRDKICTHFLHPWQYRYCYKAPLSKKYEFNQFCIRNGFYSEAHNNKMLEVVYGDETLRYIPPS